MKVETVIFDYSGTIGDDFPKVFPCVNRLLANHGVVPLTEKEFRENVTWPFQEFLSKYVEDVSGDKLLNELVEQKMKARERDKPIPGAKEALDFLKKRGVKTTLFSAIHAEELMPFIEEFFGADKFDEFWCGYEDKKEVLPELLKKSKLRPERTVFVCDAVEDIAAAHAANIKSIAVLTGWQPLKKVKEAEPDMIIESVADLPPLFE